jgi:hypothetical protein
VLTAAFDESGSHQDARFVSIAGYVADVTRWELFVRRWVPALRKHGVPRWPPPKPGESSADPFFHMTDFENRKKQFTGWTIPRRIRLFRRLADLIDQFTLFGFAVSVDRAAYAKVIAPRMPENTGYRDPYMWCMQACMEALYHGKRGTRGIGFGVSIHDPAPIACVFEGGHVIQGKVLEYYQHFRDRWGARDVFGAFGFDTKLNFVPLQAADILAYEARKSIMNRGVRPVRKSLARLRREGRIAHGFYTEQELVRTALRIEAAMRGEVPAVSPATDSRPRED